MLTVQRFVIALFLLMPSWVFAQQSDPAQYTIFFAGPGTEGITAQFVVTNVGGDAQEPATASLTALGEDDVLVTETIDPLAAGEIITLSLMIPDGTFIPGSVQPIAVVLTSTEFEAAQATASISIPDDASAPPSDPPEPASEAPSWVGQIEDALAFLPFEVDLTNRLQLAGIILIVAITFLLIWLFLVIVRLIFRTAPRFANYPPPYAGIVVQDPDSISGRRQMWQQVTQNGSVLASAVQSALHARKLLFGTDGQLYSGWSLTGLRLSQYDSYGRISQSQVIAEKGWVRQMNRLLGQPLNAEKAARRVRPVARKLAGRLRRRVNKRNARLPLALDASFEGVHGEVTIVFELYQVDGGQWKMLDNWQPEMTVPGKKIHEMYTYSLAGQHPDETLRAYRKRVATDVAQVLVEVLLCRVPSSQGIAAPKTVTNQQPVPDTEVNMDTAPSSPTETS